MSLLNTQDLALEFPPAFAWGTATSAYQIEGGWNAGGKGPSIWDTFCRREGVIRSGDTGEVAADHYHRWAQDIELLKTLGVNAYRFSISWPRLLPEGTGRVNQTGLDFYSRLVDALLEAGITPYATLYHWDLPQALEDQGGWPARQTAYAFAEYTALATRTLGDRVKHWFTINEPWVVAIMGYQTGEHAPGRQEDAAALAAAHHLLLAHGLALPIIRHNSPGCRAGIVLNLSPVEPVSPSPADRAAARWQDGNLNRWFLDPLAGREYPADISAALAPLMDFRQPGDMEIIARPVDFLGVNYYTRQLVHDGSLHPNDNLPACTFPNAETTGMSWEVYPTGLYDLLSRLKREYPFGAYLVTENGAAYRDHLTGDGYVVDLERRNFLRSHLAALAWAIDEGAPVQGYFYWSLLDNFEWAYGYSKRFGLVHVDYATQERRLKESGRWFAAFLDHLRENPS